jgi:hypothetical protein
MDCLITKNRPQMGLERTSRFIHHIQWEYPFYYVEEFQANLLCHPCQRVCKRWHTLAWVFGERLLHNCFDLRYIEARANCS